MQIAPFLVFASLVLAAPEPAAADPRPASTHLTVVSVPAPWWAPRFLIESRMESSVPRYAAVPGLARKYFTLAEDGTSLGGIYLWRDAAAAEAFFDAAWDADIRERYGKPADVWRLEIPARLRATRAGDTGDVLTDRSLVASVVRVAPPPGTPRADILAGFEAARERFLAVPGLLQKDFSVDREGRVGGVYLWETRAAADAFHDAQWRDAVAGRFGTAPELAIFDVPVLLDNADR